MRTGLTFVLAMIMLLPAISFIDGSAADDDLTYFTVDGRSYQVIDGSNVSLVYADDGYAAPEFVVGPTVTYNDVVYNIVSISGTIDCPQITKISIVSDILETVESYSLEAENLESIEVIDSNPYLEDIDGVLYNKIMSKIIRFPQKKTVAGDVYDIPASVSEVCRYSFKGTSLRIINMTNNVVNIGDSAFYGCTSLERAGDSEGKLSNNLIAIGFSAFYGCTSLSSITLPDSLNYIGSYAFQDSGIGNITIPDLVEYIGEGAFAGCKNITEFEAYCRNYEAEDGVLYAMSNDSSKRVLFAYPAGKADREFTIQDDVINIDSNAFYGTVNLERINLSRNFASIPEDAFSGCHSLKEIDLSNVTYISSMAFYDCTGITSVNFSDKLTYIGYSAFEHTSIQTLDLPASLTYVSNSAFCQCEQLKSVNIQEGSRMTIECDVFYGCIALEKITINSKDVILEDNSLAVGSISHEAEVDVEVAKGLSIPENVGNEFTKLNISVIGERPYPYENLVAAFFCILVLIGILYGMRQV